MMRPLGDRVVIRVLESEAKTNSGIFLPDSAKEKPQEGEVLAVGKGRLTESGTVVPLDIEVGDRVIFSKYAGTVVKSDDGEVLIISARDILAVL